MYSRHWRPGAGSCGTSVEGLRRTLCVTVACRAVQPVHDTASVQNDGRTSRGGRNPPRLIVAAALAAYGVNRASVDLDRSLPLAGRRGCQEAETSPAYGANVSSTQTMVHRPGPTTRRTRRSSVVRARRSMVCAQRFFVCGRRSIGHGRRFSVSRRWKWDALYGFSSADNGSSAAHDEP
jgi:hypothetical protein